MLLLGMYRIVMCRIPADSSIVSNILVHTFIQQCHDYYNQAKSYALWEQQPVKFLLLPELPAADARFTATSVRNPAKNAKLFLPDTG